jgi:hypothetical protein
MNIGDMVRNVVKLHIGPVSPDPPISPGHLGLVVSQVPEGGAGPLYSYVDVLLSVDGRLVQSGYHVTGHFKVIA